MRFSLALRTDNEGDKFYLRFVISEQGLYFSVSGLANPSESGFSG